MGSLVGSALSESFAAYTVEKQGNKMKRHNINVINRFNLLTSLSTGINQGVMMQEQQTDLKKEEPAYFLKTEESGKKVRSVQDKAQTRKEELSQ